jgi:hypothetical protein
MNLQRLAPSFVFVLGCFFISCDSQYIPPGVEPTEAKPPNQPVPIPIPIAIDLPTEEFRSSSQAKSEIESEPVDLERKPESRAKEPVAMGDTLPEGKILNSEYTVLLQKNEKITSCSLQHAVMLQNLCFVASGSDDWNNACKTFDGKDGDSHKVTVTGSGLFNYQDIFNLALWNIQYSFKDAETSNQIKLTSGTDWKRKKLDLLVEIFLKFCDNDYVKKEYVYVMRELGLIYQNSIPGAKNSEEKWEKVSKMLEKCKGSNVKEGKFEAVGFIVSFSIYECINVCFIICTNYFDL